jgi:hypothetical protein
MSLYLNERNKYAEPYHVNFAYLGNMTSLQTKSLNEITWYEASKYIHTKLWYVPLAWPNEENAKSSVEGFITTLNDKIKRL